MKPNTFKRENFSDLAKFKPPKLLNKSLKKIPPDNTPTAVPFHCTHVSTWHAHVWATSSEAYGFTLGLAVGGVVSYSACTL